MPLGATAGIPVGKSLCCLSLSTPAQDVKTRREPSPSRYHVCTPIMIHVTPCSRFHARARTGSALVVLSPRLPSRSGLRLLSEVFIRIGLCRNGRRHIGRRICFFLRGFDPLGAQPLHLHPAEESSERRRAHHRLARRNVTERILDLLPARCRDGGKVKIGERLEDGMGIKRVSEPSGPRPAGQRVMIQFW